MAYKNVIKTDDIDLIHDNQFDDKEKFLKLVDIVIEHMDEFCGDTFEAGFVQGRGVRITRKNYRTVKVEMFINPELEDKE